MTATDAPTLAPAVPRRLPAVDAARGIALIGMMAVHSLVVVNPAGQATLPFSIFGGRAAAMFAVLAGVAIAFMTGRRRVEPAALPATAAMLMTRALLIGLIGLCLGYADPTYAVVILPYYAILFLLAIPLVLLPSWALGAIGAGVVSIVPPLTFWLQPRLPEPTLGNPSFVDAVTHPLALLSELTVTGEFPALPWVAYLCVGLIVGRLPLARLRTAVTLLVTGAVLAVGAAVTSWALLTHLGGLRAIWAAQRGSGLTVAETNEVLRLGGDGTMPTSTHWWLAVAAPHTSTPLDLIGTIGAAIGVLGLLLVLGQLRGRVSRRIVAVVLAPFAAAGGMTLTFYTAHVMFINSRFDSYGPATGYVLQVVAVLLIGLVWKATAGKGPLEAFVTALSSVGVTRRAQLVPPSPTRRPGRPAPNGSARAPAGRATGRP